jgi:oxygen-independent coproporphyrinogen-3 oxidase
MSQAAQTGARVVATFTSPGQVRLTLPPLALYVHFPWCVRKCPYCDFNSHEWKGERFPKPSISTRCAPISSRRCRSSGAAGAYGVHRRRHAQPAVGGRPRPAAVRRALLPLDADAEITLEANPGTFEAAKFAQFRASGVNRLSVGIQSFNEGI